MTKGFNFQTEESFSKSISEIAKAIEQIESDAVLAYTSLVHDICNREATEEEVDHLLSDLLGFVEFERMLELFKKVCRTYFYTYPEVIVFLCF